MEQVFFIFLCFLLFVGAVKAIFQKSSPYEHVRRESGKYRIVSVTPDGSFIPYFIIQEKKKLFWMVSWDTLSTDVECKKGRLTSVELQWENYNEVDKYFEVLIQLNKEL